MSRIGNKSIPFPAGTTVNVDSNNLVTVKGPKGELKQQVHPDLKVAIEDGVVTVTRPTDQKRHKAAHGLYRTLVNNMIVGVADGYKKELELVGVGYKAEADGQVLELNVGYSHLVLVVLPDEIKVSTETLKGKPPRITMESIDKQMLGHFASKIRELRPPEPYKGKGIRYVDERITIKETKKK